MSLQFFPHSAVAFFRPHKNLESFSKTEQEAFYFRGSIHDSNDQLHYVLVLQEKLEIMNELFHYELRIICNLSIHLS